MQTAASFSGFSFSTTPGGTDTWVIVDIDGTLTNANGAAGATFPMLTSEYSTTINNAHQLQLMAMNPAASYTLGQNINAAGTGNGLDVWSSSGFAPIGNSTTLFGGIFDGHGYAISNLTMDLPSAKYVGLFGYTNSTAVIQNVGLIGGSVTGGSYYAGGLVGFNAGAVNNSYATGTVSDSGAAGGLVGYNGGKISNSYATGNVSGSADVGGLAGWNFGAINNSYATDDVIGVSYVGGLAGQNVSTISFRPRNAGNVSEPLSLVGLSVKIPKLLRTALRQAL